MKKRLVALGMYFLFWYAFFIIARGLFIFGQWEDTIRYPAGTILSTFCHGLRLDLSATGYVMIIPMLLSLPAVWFTGRWMVRVVDVYTIMVIILFSVITIVDIVVYSYWGYRIDITPLFYMKTPGAMLASVNTWQIILFLLAILCLSVPVIFFYNRIIRRHFQGMTPAGLSSFVVILILFAGLILPIRGGTGIAPVNLGSAYFHKDAFPNHAAINEIWNMGNSLVNHQPGKNPYVFMNHDEAETIVAGLTGTDGVSDNLLLREDPNILIIILEGFSGSLLGQLGGDTTVAPCLNRYVNEGVLFSRFYATGVRTDKCIPGILCGYPSQPTTSIMKNPRKTQSLPSLASIFASRGYGTSFWYGGDLEFANMKSFIHNAGFRRMITKDDFEKSSYNSKWGVHDHVLYDRLINNLDTARQPFFTVALSLSSHEPFEIPIEPVFEGNDRVTLFRNSAYYADWALGSFVEKARTSHWWDNTLVIVVPDHCWRLPGTMAYDPLNFHIFMLWMGGALKEKGRVIDKTGSQTDIPPTLLRQCGMSGEFRFGKNLLAPDASSFAFYAYNEGFGMIMPGSYAVYNFNKSGPVMAAGQDSLKAEILGKACLQVLTQDYLER